MRDEKEIRSKVCEVRSIIEELIGDTDALLMDEPENEDLDDLKSSLEDIADDMARLENDDD